MNELYTYCMDASSSRIHNNLKYSREFYNKHAQLLQDAKFISKYSRKTYNLAMNIIRIQCI